jgi:hypothetical protein
MAASVHVPPAGICSGDQCSASGNLAENCQEALMKPLQAKIFSYCTTNINPPGELQLNEWLAENPDVEIVHALQSESIAVKKDELERNLTVTLLYR